MRSAVHLTSVHPADDTRICFKECATLAQAGYSVTLVAQGRMPDEVDDVRLVEFRPPKSRLTRIAVGARQMYGIARSFNADIYHIHDPELLPMALRLARHGEKVIYDAHELVRSDLQAKPYLPPVVRNIAGLAVGQYESFVASRIAGVVAATPTIAKVFNRLETVVVANYPINDEFAAHRVTSLAEYESRGRVATYVGGIRPDRGAREMIETAHHLTSEGVTIHLAGRVDHMDISDGPGITYHGELQRTAVVQLLGASRIGLSVLRPHPNYLESLPTKVFEYMACGIPVVVSTSTATMASIVQEIGCGLVLESERPDEIADAIRYLLANTAEAYEMGQRGLKTAEQSLSWESQAPELLGLYERILCH